MAAAYGRHPHDLHGRFELPGARLLGDGRRAVLRHRTQPLSDERRPVTQQATLTQLNGSTAITGNGFVRMADNNACMVILQPGTNNMWTWSLTSAASPYVGTFAVLTVPAGYPTVTMNLWYLDNFIVFLGGGAQTKTFYNDQGFSVTGFAQISFATSPVASFTREFGTDPFVAESSITGSCCCSECARRRAT